LLLDSEEDNESNDSFGKKITGSQKEKQVEFIKTLKEKTDDLI